MVVSASSGDNGTPFLVHGSVYMDVAEGGKVKIRATMNGPSNGAEVLSVHIIGKGGKDLGHTRDHYLTQLGLFQNTTVTLETREPVLSAPGRYTLRFKYRNKKIADVPVLLKKIGEKDVLVKGQLKKIPLLKEVRNKKLGQAWLDTRSHPDSVAVIVNLKGTKNGKSLVQTVWKHGRRLVALEKRNVDMHKDVIERFVLRGIMKGNDPQVPDKVSEEDSVLAEELGNDPDGPEDGIAWLKPDDVLAKRGLWTIQVKVDNKLKRVMSFKVDKRRRVVLVGIQRKGKIQTPFFLLKTKVVKP